MAGFKPVVGKEFPTNTPVIVKPPEGQDNWSFSFRYFNQTKYFGLSELDPKWFISLLDKLRDLCKEDVNNFFRDHGLKQGNRYHKINWDAKNIPIKRSEIDWVDKVYINNEEDYPFFQFQISTGLGRVVGFWDQTYTFFNIVLLDPKHNMQPSKKFDYKVDDTTIIHCELTSLLVDFDKVKGASCTLEECQCKIELSKIPSNLNRGKLISFQLDDDYFQILLDKTKDKSIRDVIELGLLQL